MDRVIFKRAEETPVEYPMDPVTKQEYMPVIDTYYDETSFMEKQRMDDYLMDTDSDRFEYNKVVVNAFKSAGVKFNKQWINDQIEALYDLAQDKEGKKAYQASLHRDTYSLEAQDSPDYSDEDGAQGVEDDMPYWMYESISGENPLFDFLVDNGLVKVEYMSGNASSDVEGDLSLDKYFGDIASYLARGAYSGNEVEAQRETADDLEPFEGKVFYLEDTPLGDIEVDASYVFDVLGLRKIFGESYFHYGTVTYDTFIYKKELHDLISDPDTRQEFYEAIGKTKLSDEDVYAFLGDLDIYHSVEDLSIDNIDIVKVDEKDYIRTNVRVTLKDYQDVKEDLEGKTSVLQIDIPNKSFDIINEVATMVNIERMLNFHFLTGTFPTAPNHALPGQVPEIEQQAADKKKWRKVDKNMLIGDDTSTEGQENKETDQLNYDDRVVQRRAVV